MKQLSKQQIYSGDGETLVWVYDGDVEYVPHYKYKNYPEYKTSEGKRYKTRNYNQWLAMTHRTNPTSKNYEHVNTYVGASLEEHLRDFDHWCEWAETQVGYMWTTDNNRLWQVDKDLKGDGKKTYSRETITFLPNWLNSGLCKREGDTHIGLRKFYQRVYDEFFEVFDDSALEAMLKLTSFNYGLNTETRKTANEAEAYQKYLSKTQVVSSLFNGLLSWDDLNNPYQSIVFTQGKYAVSSKCNGKKVLDGNYSRIRDVVVAKIDSKLEALDMLNSEFEDCKIFIEQNFERIVLDKKAMLLEAKYHWSNVDNKLLQWTQVEV